MNQTLWKFVGLKFNESLFILQTARPLHIQLWWILPLSTITVIFLIWMERVLRSMRELSVPSKATTPSSFTQLSAIAMERERTIAFSFEWRVYLKVFIFISFKHHMTSCEDESLKYFILKNCFYFSVSFCLLSWFYNVYSFRLTFMLVLMIHRCFVNTKTKQNTIINNLSVKKESNWSNNYFFHSA